jgi:hypothetical protein
MSVKITCAARILSGELAIYDRIMYYIYVSTINRRYLMSYPSRFCVTACTVLVITIIMYIEG